MNSEYALIKLVLADPHLTTSLNRKGLRKKHFRNETFGKAYKMIYDTYLNYKSIPTEEQFKSIDLKLGSESVPHTLEHCVNQVITDYRKRLTAESLLAASKALTIEGADSALEIMRKANSYMPKLENEGRSKDITDSNEEFMERYEFRESQKGKLVGIPTGFTEIDQITMGLREQWLVVISGRNGQFKTWVLLSWVLEAWKAGKNIALFSCEMSTDELEDRTNCLAAKVPPLKWQQGSVSFEEKLAMKNFLKSNKDFPYGKLIINDYPGSMSLVKDEVEEMNKSTPIDIVFIDSAYRMNSDGDNETTKQAAIARSAKNLAKDLKVPVVCSVQLNRDFAKANSTDKTKGKTASGAHYVHGTDAWEQDADLIFAIHRPEDYEPYHYSDFICTKFRHGPKLPFILEINPAVPKIQQINEEEAKSRIEGRPTAQTQKADVRFTQAKGIIDQQNLNRLARLEQQFKDSKGLNFDPPAQDKDKENGV